MRFAILLSLSVWLIACSNQPAPAGGGRIYSYVDAQGNLVQGQMPAAPKAAAPMTPGEKPAAAIPKLYSYKDAQGNLVQGELPPSATTAPVDAKDYQPADQAEAKVEAKAHDRFVTYYNAEGTLIRERIDPVTAKAYRQEQFDEKDYQVIAAQAAQQARARQFVETSTPISADCCRDLLKYADKLKIDKEKTLAFSAGEYGWITLDVPHPAHIYALGKQVHSLTIKSFKDARHYLHPYLLFLDAKGTPLLAINNLFQRRYAETWYRYAYVEGSVTVPAQAAYVIVYLPYETGSRQTGMVSFAAPALVPEADATPTDHGQLAILGLSS